MSTARYLYDSFFGTAEEACPKAVETTTSEAQLNELMAEFTSMGPPPAPPLPPFRRSTPVIRKLQTKSGVPIMQNVAVIDVEQETSVTAAPTFSNQKQALTYGKISLFVSQEFGGAPTDQDAVEHDFIKLSA